MWSIIVHPGRPTLWEGQTATAETSGRTDYVVGTRLLVDDFGKG